SCDFVNRLFSATKMRSTKSHELTRTKIQSKLRVLTPTRYREVGLTPCKQRPKTKGHHFVIRRFEKCATVPGPTHKAIAPLVNPCFRSLTSSVGWDESCTNKRAFSPFTSIFTLVHSPGTRST